MKDNDTKILEEAYNGLKEAFGEYSVDIHLKISGPVDYEIIEQDIKLSGDEAVYHVYKTIKELLHLEGE
jgi:hypothetical protein